MPKADEKFLKVIACEIAFREICHVVAQCRHVVDVEFLTQGLHDHPNAGREELQKRIDAVPPKKYDGILVGYALCGNLITGLRTAHTPLVIPRGHDCITFFLGSKERYQQLSESHPGSYYYTSGWLECLRRRGDRASLLDMRFLPSRAGLNTETEPAYADWVKKYGEERAQYLLEVMGQWTDSYTHGILIDFDFAKPLRLREQVSQICERRGWNFEQVPGDLQLLQRWLNGDWDNDSFLILQPGEKVEPSYDPSIIRAENTENK
jgi:Protein of unknown function (DUF1638)